MGFKEQRKFGDLGLLKSFRSYNNQIEVTKNDIQKSLKSDSSYFALIDRGLTPALKFLLEYIKTFALSVFVSLFLLGSPTSEGFPILSEVLYKLRRVIKSVCEVIQIGVVNFFVNFGLFLVNGERVVLVASVRLNVEQLLSVVNRGSEIRITTIPHLINFVPFTPGCPDFLQILGDFHLGPRAVGGSRGLFECPGLILTLECCVGQMAGRVVLSGVSLLQPQGSVDGVFDLEVVGDPALLVVEMRVDEILLMHYITIII